jgi:hypothetical protein
VNLDNPPLDDLLDSSTFSFPSVADANDIFSRLLVDIRRFAERLAIVEQLSFHGKTP